MPEHYQPGQRNPRFGQNHQIAETRWAWVQCEAGNYTILVGEDEGSGRDVVLFRPMPGRQRDQSIKLTDLTIAELDALETLFKDAFEWARPVVEQRDKEAQDAWDQGDDSYIRSHRAAPTVVYRKRPFGEHGEGVRERPSGVPASDGRGGAGGVRGAGDELAQPQPEQGGSEDDGSSAD